MPVRGLCSDNFLLVFSCLNTPRSNAPFKSFLTLTNSLPTLPRVSVFSWPARSRASKLVQPLSFSYFELRPTKFFAALLKSSKKLDIDLLIFGLSSLKNLATSEKNCDTVV